MLCDLHIHTYYSDGVFSPEEVIEQVLAKGIKLISITDHNSLEAYPEINKLCDENDIGLLSGVEIDCRLDGKNVHLLGYGIELEDEQFLNMIRDIKDKMDAFHKEMIYNMAKNYDIDLDDYEDFFSHPEACSYVNFDYLVKLGYIEHFEDLIPLFKKYGGDRAKIDIPDFRTALNSIHKAGGKAAVSGQPCSNS